MRYYVIAVLAIYGAYYYVTNKAQMDEPLVFARKHKQADWAPAADYYLGVIYYQRSEYGKAQDAFTQLLTDYPTGQYTEKALLKLADAAEYNHDWDTAKGSIARYIEEFPSGKDIETARKRLDLLKYQHP